MRTQIWTSFLDNITGGNKFAQIDMQKALGSALMAAPNPCAPCRPLLRASEERREAES